MRRYRVINEQTGETVARCGSEKSARRWAAKQSTPHRVATNHRGGGAIHDEKQT